MSRGKRRCSFAVCVLLYSGLPLIAQTELHVERLRQLNGEVRRPGMNQAGLARVLADRAGALRTLIESDPRAAVSLALPSDEIERLNRALPGRGELLETRGEWRGPVIAGVEDDFQNRASRTRWEMKAGGRSVQLHFADAPPLLACEREMAVSGIRLGDHVAAASARVSDPAAGSSPCTNTGVQQTAVLLLSYPGTPLAVSSAYIQDIFFGPHSVNGFYGEQSFGQMSLAGAVFGPFTLDANYTCNDMGAIVAAAIRAADSSVDFTQYKRIMLIVPDTGCGIYGFSYIGCGAQTSPSRGQFTAGFSKITVNNAAPSSAILAVAAHEFGHTLGLQQAHSLDFGAEVLGSSGGLFNDYGDPFSVMGNHMQMGHFNAQQKLAVGWLNGAQNVLQVQNNGTFVLKPIGASSTGLQAIRVQRAPNSTNWLWVEFRQAGSSYESFSQPEVNLYNGALIHYEEGDPLAVGTEILDFTPTQSPNNFGDAALTAGRSWKDKYGPLTLTVNSAGSSGLSVSVAYGDTVFASANSLNFTVASSSQPQTQSLSLTASGTGYSYTAAASSNGNWLTASPSSGTIPSSLNVTVNAAGLSAGNYTGSVTITAPGAVNSPLTVPVNLTVPAAGAAGSWSFDTADISGNTAIDRSGNAINAGISNAAPVAGKVNQALSFSGAGSYAAVPDNAGMRLTHDLTLTAWIRTQNNSQTQNFLSKYDFSGQETGYILQTLPNGVLNLRVGGNNLAGGGRDAADTTPVNDGQWHHVAVAIGLGQDVTFYIDGRLSSTQPQSIAASQNATPLYIGTFPGAYYGAPFTGSLDEVKVYARRLGAAEVLNMAGSSGPAITSFSPASYPQGTSFTITVNGSGFVPGAVVFEPDAANHPGLAALQTTYVSPTQLTAVVPRDFTMYPATLKFQVYNGYPNGAASAIATYSITAITPAISSLSPNSAPAGGSDFVLTVNGSNFIAPCSCYADVEPGASVTWNGTKLLTTWYSSTKVTTTVSAAMIANAGTATVVVTNPGGSSAPVTFTIGSTSTPVTMSCTPANGPVQTGTAYSATCTASGGVAPYSWDIGSGQLPAGVSLNSNGGATATISGTPSAPGPYAYTVRTSVSTPTGVQQASQTFNGTVRAPMSVSCSPTAGPVQAGASYSSTCTASSGVAPISWSISAGTLPAGLSLAAGAGGGSTATVSGTPTGSGSYSYTVTATDSASPVNRQSVVFSGSLAGASAVAPAAAGYWTFDTADISGAQATDRSGNGLHGTIYNAAAVTGKVNQGLSFSGAGSYVAVPNNTALSLAHDLTLTAWVKTTNSSQTQNFISKYDFSGSENGYLLQILSTGTINLHVGGNNQGGASRDTHDTRAINDGQWHHVAVAIALGQNVRFYVDGQLSSTQSQVVLAAANAGPLYLGTYPGSYNGLPFTGSLDEVRIYGQALAASDIAAMAGGAPSTPPPAITVSVTPTSASLGAGQTKQFTANVAVNWTISPTVGSISAGGVYTAPSSIPTQQNVTVTATSQADATKTAQATVTLTPPSPPPTASANTSTASPAGWWTFDAADISGNQVSDRSGNGLNGALYNAAAVAGKSNQALSFSGAGSYVAVPNSASLQLTHDLTLTAWIKTGVTNQTQDFISKYDFTGSEYGYILQVSSGGTLNLHVGGNNLAGGSRDAGDTRVITDGQWHHVAVVITLGQNVTFYVDGIAASAQPQVTAATGNAATLYLGTFPGAYNGLPFTGALDEVRIYSRALTATEVGSVVNGAS